MDPGKLPIGSFSDYLSFCLILIRIASRRPQRLSWVATRSIAWSATVDQRAALEVSTQFGASDTVTVFVHGGGLALVVWRAQYRIGVHFD